jgi:uncharacterized protein (TIGR02246 family)
MGRARLLSLILIGAALAGPLAAQSEADREEIRKVAVRQGEFWAHDAKAYAALFTENCDVVNVVGWWWKGRAELEQKLTRAFQSMFRDSKLNITFVETRFLSPTVAISHARWSMSGAKPPPGMPEPRLGIQTLVFTKQSGHWLISAFQNSRSIPERPFLAAPAGDSR